MRNGSARYGWCAAAALSFALFLGRGVLQGFGVSVATVSVAASLGVFVDGMSQPLLGRLVDRFGGRYARLPAPLVLGLACLAMALVTTVYLLMVLYGVVMAIAVESVSPVTTGAVAARWFGRRRGAAISLLAARSGVGGLLLIPFLAYLLIATDWQTAWVVLSVIVLVLAPLALLVVRNDPGDLGLHADGDHAVERPATRRTAPRGRTAASTRRATYGP